MSRDLEDLVFMFDAELSSGNLIPLSREQSALLRRCAALRPTNYYEEILHALAKQILFTRVEKIFRGAGGELLDEEVSLAHRLSRVLVGGEHYVVQVQEAFDFRGELQPRGRVITLGRKVAEDLIREGKVKLVIRIGNPVDLDEVLPKV